MKVDIASGTRTVLLDNGKKKYHPGIDAKGNITYEAGNWIYYNNDALPTEPLKLDYSYTPSFSPDGKKIALIGRHKKKDSPFSVFIYEIKVTSDKKLYHLPGMIAWTENDGEMMYTVQDHLGSPMMTVDGQGNVISKHNFSAFGASSTENPVAFNGKLLDEETGLVYYGFRFFDTDMGRWLTPDPLGYVDGPNIYAYAENDPVNNVDQLGLYGEDVHFYLTYILCRHAGYGHSEAFLIAGSCQYTDENRYTEPMQGLLTTQKAIDSRSKYHFFNTSNINQSVVMNDPLIRGKLITSTDNSVFSFGGHRNSFRLIGLLTHVYQDTWGHMGYNAKRGHGFPSELSNSESVYYPDMTYKRPMTAFHMAYNVYNIFSNKMKSSTDWKSFSPALLNIMSSFGSEKYDEDQEIKIRLYKEYIRSQGWGDVVYNRTEFEKRNKSNFEYILKFY